MPETSNEILIVVIYGTLILLLAVVVLIAFLFMFQKRQFQNRQEKQRLQDQYEREVLRTQLEVQEQTHQQISRDLHDNVGQSLAVVRLYLKGMTDAVQDDRLNKRLTETDNLVGDAINDLRNLAHSLSSERIMKSGLRNELAAETGRIQSAGKIKMTMEGEELKTRVNHEIELVLFRMCQELFANIIRHSQAQNCNITLWSTDDQLQISIVDDGIGFTPGKGDGSGLFNLYRRAELIGAKIDIVSEPDKGTKATIIWVGKEIKE